MSVDPTAIDIWTDPTHQRMVGTTVHRNMAFDVPYISEIAENLWQGGCDSGLVLPPHIKHVVSLYRWEKYQLEHELDSFLEVKMYDSTEHGIDPHQILMLAAWVNLCRDTGPVLVHCQAGLNRSSMVAATALVLSREFAPADAIAHLRAHRSSACLCNPKFEEFVLGLRMHANQPIEFEEENT